MAHTATTTTIKKKRNFMTYERQAFKKKKNSKTFIIKACNK